MSYVQNWHDIVMRVENANLDKLNAENQIKAINKRIYKQQLDHEVQQRKQAYTAQHALKSKERQQAKKLAQAQKNAKIKQKKVKEEIEKKYGQENLNIINHHNKVKTVSQQIQRKNIKKFLQHPFVKLVDEQEFRSCEMRKNFVRQNQINRLQQQMKNKTKNIIKQKQSRERNDFIQYVQKDYQRRSQQRERFKNKYLKIKKSQMLSEQKHVDLSNMTVEKMYISYLNNQIDNERVKKQKRKAQSIDDKRIQKFYSKNTQPDSSPAYLGRNPLNYQRRRQLYYIGKHLNSSNPRTNTGNNYDSNIDYSTPLILSNQKQYPSNTFSQHQADLLNPEVKTRLQKKSIHPLNSIANHQHSQSVNIRPYPLNSSTVYEQKQTYNTSRYRNNKIQHEVPINNRQYHSPQSHKFFNYEDSKCRVKSQLIQEKYKPSFALPSVGNNSLVRSEKPISNTVSKKQYMRYDVISGKNIPFYI